MFFVLFSRHLKKITFVSQVLLLAAFWADFFTINTAEVLLLEFSGLFSLLQPLLVKFWKLYSFSSKKEIRKRMVIFTSYK